MAETLMPDASAFDLETTYLSLNGSGVVTDLPGEHFMARMAACPPDMAYLVGVYPTTVDWDHWEMHPKGHEVLVMLDGRLELTLDDNGALSTVMFGPGATLVVQPGVWHRARVLQPGRMLGLTYGEGTQHRPWEGAPS